MAHDVFVSYSNKDKPVADAVVARLENKGIRCWIAPRDVPPGYDWASILVNAIDNSLIFVLVLSKYSNISKQVIREVAEAVEMGIPIIPLRIEDIEPTQAMRYYIKSLHWLDAMSPPLEKHLGELTSSVQALLSVKGKPSEATVTVVEKTTQKQGSSSVMGEWRTIKFNIPNVKLWRQPADGIYISVTHPPDTIAWSEEIVEGDISISLNVASQEKDAECQVIVYGNGMGFTQGSLLFTFGKGYYKLEKHSTYHQGENWLVLTAANVDFRNHVYSVLIEIVGDKASLYLDGEKVASTFFALSEVNRRGRIGLSKTWEMLGDVTYSNIKIKSLSCGLGE
ncbi:MAG: toll/interleukin-1 receptor domain-containing protein [Anaerolineae bacterium]|nr:toll/interleukin-1 receptor domain-containing protein [Anaerolineae bacterium]